MRLLAYILVAAVAFAAGWVSCAERLAESVEQEIARATPTCDPVYMVVTPKLGFSIMAASLKASCEIYRSVKKEDALRRASTAPGVELWEERGGREKKLPLSFLAESK